MKKEEKKEEYVRVLDYLPYGYPEDPRPIYQKKPVVQAIGERYFTLLELIPKEGKSVNIHQRVYIGEGEREHINHVKRRLRWNELTNAARSELPYVVEEIVKEREKEFVEFFNKAQPITPRLNALELLPGVGKKLMWTILEERQKGEFKSFGDLSQRVKGLHHPEKLIAKRIIEELKDENIKYRIFVR
jgi:putative nucleotide binding protein